MRDLPITSEDVAEQVVAYHHYQAMQQKQLFFIYCGELTHDMMTSILQVSDLKLQELKATNRKKKNVINILIECLQNVISHGQEEGVPELNKGCIVALGHEAESYTIIAGNHLNKKDADRLKSRLDEVARLDAATIHTLYLEQLSKAEISDKGGAGLGLLRILRESNQQLAYTLKPVTNENFFFSLQIQVHA